MWQSGTLQGLLDGIDGVGIRPVFRAAAPLAPLAADEMAPVDRRRLPRRTPDPESRGATTKEIASMAASAALDRLDLAIVLLKSNRHVLQSNPAAQRVAARRDCFHIAAAKLQLVDHQHQRVLETFLSDRTPSSLSYGGPLCVTRRNDNAPSYFLFAEWLNVSLTHGRVASLLIYEPRRAGQLCHELLGKLYGLTKMESRLVAAIFIEPVLQTAADSCGIAVNTAKTHLKHVFAKCGVHSKAELLRLTALGPRTL